MRGNREGGRMRKGRRCVRYLRAEGGLLAGRNGRYLFHAGGYGESSFEAFVNGGHHQRAGQMRVLSLPRVRIQGDVLLE